MIHYEPQLLCLSINCTKLVCNKSNKTNHGRMLILCWNLHKFQTCKTKPYIVEICINYRETNANQAKTHDYFYGKEGDGVGREAQVYFKGIGNILFLR